jgi:DNA transformation protein and related proteins
LSGAHDPDFLTELFAGFGPIAVRRMFSGAGVFADGLMIALVVVGVIYLKADDSFVPLFEREGQAPFSYKTRDGRRTLNSYWRMPERLYDEPDELAEWATLAQAAARRAAPRGGKTQKRAKSQAKSKSKSRIKSGVKPAKRKRQ